MKSIIRRIITSVHGLFDHAAKQREGEVKRLDDAVARKAFEVGALQKELAEQKNATAQANSRLARFRVEAHRKQESYSASAAALRHDLEKVRRELEVAQAENRRLWEVYERDHARVLKERALFDRQRADAETAAVLTRQEE